MADLTAAAAAAKIDVASVVDNIIATVPGPLKPSPTPVVSVDLDGTLCFKLVCVVIVVNAKFGKTVDAATLDSIKAWMSPKASDFYHDQLKDDPDFNLNLPPFMSGIAGVNAIHLAGYHVAIRTCRDPKLQATTATWLQRWGVQYDELVCGGKGCKETFAATATAKRPIMFIDDDPKFVYTLPGPYRTLWLVDHSYTPNSVNHLPGVTVFTNWTAPLEYLGIGGNVPQASFELTAPDDKTLL